MIFAGSRARHAIFAYRAVRWPAWPAQPKRGGRCGRRRGGPAGGARACTRPARPAGAWVGAQLKTNEITVFTALLAQAGDLDGALVAADALHAQREHATWLHERGAHYLVTWPGTSASPSPSGTPPGTLCARSGCSQARSNSQ